MTYALLFRNMRGKKKSPNYLREKTSGGLNYLKLLSKALPYLEIKLVQT